MERFKKIYQQRVTDVVKIWVDTETNVNYVFHRNGNAAGFTLLLDKEGKPIVAS
ncbi:MAG TPA: xylan 1,4-beta-xylosidase [Candidatus Coprocola pullicola]|nr:xylan 1,4-beta-xylosidase [Candidatus Coprocola pullicola]